MHCRVQKSGVNSICLVLSTLEVRRRIKNNLDTCFVCYVVSELEIVSKRKKKTISQIGSLSKSESSRSEASGSKIRYLK